MPKRARNWLSRAAGGLSERGARALGAGDGRQHGAGRRHPSVLAQELDCYNDKDVYSMAECAAQRELDRKTGNAPKDASDPQVRRLPPDPIDRGPAQRGRRAAAGERRQQSGGQQSGGQQQQAAQSSEEEEEEKPAPRVPPTDPRQVALTIADAGQGSDPVPQRRGHRQVRQVGADPLRARPPNGASALGPNVMDSKVWVAKDVETAKTLFKEQAAIKNFPERTEKVNGPVEKIKPTKYGEEFSFVGGYFQDEKIWQHYRFVIRVGKVLSVVYLFGREEFFQDPKDGGWTGQGDWFTSAVANRM